MRVKPAGVACVVLWEQVCVWLPSHAVDVVVSGSRLERRTVVGESPVRESGNC